MAISENLFPAPPLRRSTRRGTKINNIKNFRGSLDLKSLMKVGMPINNRGKRMIDSLAVLYTAGDNERNSAEMTNWVNLCDSRNENRKYRPSEINANNIDSSKPVRE